MRTRWTSFTLFWDGKYLGRSPGTERAADRGRALRSPSSPAWDHPRDPHCCGLLLPHKQQNVLGTRPWPGTEKEIREVPALKEGTVPRCVSLIRAFALVQQSLCLTGYIQELCDVNCVKG